MKKYLAIIALLVACPVVADVETYVEVDGKEITLAGQCRCDGINWGLCAVADRSMVKSDEDMVMCWREEGGKIIFTNRSMTIERRLDDVKIRVIDGPFLPPDAGPSSGLPPA
ncbi:MAG: hypothetical protein IPM03_08320 [Sulfuritalea sp.]|nr:hypothetical protein [Sulfuritalea sp.]